MLVKLEENFKKDLQITGEHFNSAGHSIHDMRVTVIEKVFKDSKIYRETRESMFIRDFESEHKGLNKDK